MIRLPRNAVVLEPAEVDYIARGLELLGQLMAERRDAHGNPSPSQPTPKLAMLTTKLRRAVGSLAVPQDGAEHAQQAEPPEQSASVRALQRDPLHGGRHDIGTGEAARYLGITPNAVRDLARRGRIQARHTGTRWVFPADAVAAQAQRRQAGRRTG